MKVFRTTRDVTFEECEWLANHFDPDIIRAALAPEIVVRPDTVPRGMIFFEYLGETYGCINELNVGDPDDRNVGGYTALTRIPGKLPFFGFPTNALEEITNVLEDIKGDK